MIVELIYKYLRYDIEQLTYRYGKARQNDNAELFDLTALEGDDTSDDNLMQRFCLTGVAKLRMLLKDHLEKYTDDANDVLNDDTKWTFKFTSDEYDATALASLMHWFVVRWALWQWCLAFAPSDARTAKSDLDDAEDEMKNLLLDSAMPTKDRRKTYDEESEETEMIVDEEEIVVTNEP